MYAFTCISFRLESVMQMPFRIKHWKLLTANVKQYLRCIAYFQVIVSVCLSCKYIIDLFSNPIYCVLYLIWFVAIWFHLTHGFWSAFQTIGWDNQIWLGRLKCIANVFATIIFLGFAVVVIAFYVRSLCCCGVC